MTTEAMKFMFLIGLVLSASTVPMHVVHARSILSRLVQLISPEEIAILQLSVALWGEI